MIIARNRRRLAAGALLAALLTAIPAPAALAKAPTITGSFDFDPITSSATCGSKPLDAPFVLPAGFSQHIIESQTGDADFADLPDMNQVNETGPRAHQFLYRTHEVGSNGSVSVTDLSTGETTVLAQHADWERFDGLKWTPWQTLLAAEETVDSSIPDPDFPDAESGLLYEIDPVTGDAVARPAVGSLAHEGIGIDKNGAVYVIDEFAQGGLFKFVPDAPGDLSSGQLYVLNVVDEAAAAGSKTGTAEWVPLDRDAVQVNARTAAGTPGVDYTPYGRPEDVEIVKDVLYVAITSEDRILSIDLHDDEAPFVEDFVRAGLNVPVESAGVTGLNNPDNLASDVAGNIYIAEDNAPGDIWVATPDKKPNDGAADAVHLFASLSDCSAEPTGIYFAPGDPHTLYVNVQHAGGADGNDKAMAITKD